MDSKNAGYTITKYEYADVQSDFKGFQKNNSIVFCSFDSKHDNASSKRLDISKISSSSGRNSVNVLELEANIIDSNHVIYDFQLNEVRNKDDKDGLIELTIEAKHLTQSSEISLQNFIIKKENINFLDKPHKISVDFQCPVNFSTYQLDFQQNEQAMDYHITSIRSFRINFPKNMAKQETIIKCSKDMNKQDTITPRNIKIYNNTENLNHYLNSSNNKKGLTKIKAGVNGSSGNTLRNII